MPFTDSFGKEKLGVLAPRRRDVEQDAAVRVVIFSYQIENPKWGYAALILNCGVIWAAYASFDATDIKGSPLFALRLMGRFEWTYPSIQLAKEAIAQSQSFKRVSDEALMERLKIDLLR